MLAASNSASGITVIWQSVSGKTYYLLRATDLASPGAFSAVQSNILGQAGTTSFLDTRADPAQPHFSGIRRHLSQQHADRRALAGAVVAQQPEDAAARHVQREPVDRQPRAETFGDAVE